MVATVTPRPVRVVAQAPMTADEKRARNRSYQARFHAKRRGEAVPPRGSSHDDEATATPAREERWQSVMTPAERVEHQHYIVAVRQHLEDVAKGDMPPARAGIGSTSASTDRMHRRRKNS